MDLIKTQADVDEGAVWLARIEPRFANALADLAPLPLRLNTGGFPALLDAIISQQVSLASAAAIAIRVQKAGLDSAENISAAPEADLRAAGLSTPKIRYFYALAHADLPYGNFAQMSDADVITQLTSVTGIGLWSAELYALQSLGRPDIFPAGDLALQEAAKLLFDQEARPTERTLRAQAAAWSPYRSVAARLLWAYYGTRKQRQGSDS